MAAKYKGSWWLRFMYAVHYNPMWRANGRLKAAYWFRIVFLLWLLVVGVFICPWTLILEPLEGDTNESNHWQVESLKALAERVTFIRETQIHVLEMATNTSKRLDEHLGNTGNQEVRLTILERKIDVLIGIGGFLSATFLAQVIITLFNLRVKKELLKEYENLRGRPVLYHPPRPPQAPEEDMVE